MHLRRKTRAALVAAVVLAGSPALTMPAPAHAAKAGSCTILGTPGDDVLVGTERRDVICGLGGDDKILGRGGDDVLRGGGGRDVVRGGAGDDRVAGGPGGDRVFGQSGDDVIRGDSGDDEVVGGPGNDRMGGYRGADEMRGEGDATGFVDNVRCGPGPDTAFADPADSVRPDCETITQNDPPTDITLVPASISENEPVGSDIGGLKAVDPDAGDSHTFALVPGAGSADNGLVQIDGGRVESAAGYDFEADAAFSIRVRATDETGESTEKAFTVTVTDANDAPVAVDDDATATEDTQLDLPVSGPGSPAANDTDQDGDALAVSAVSSPTGGTVSISGGQVHFVPAANVCGNNTATFVYTVSDGDSPTPGTDTGTVTVDITCVDDAPNAVDDDRTVAEDSAATTLNVLANDTDLENDPITITSFTDPAGGTVQLVGPAGAGTNLTYQPDADFCNDPPPFDTFTYTVNGGDTATVRVSVTCGNDAPVAVDDDRTTDEDTALQNPATGAGSPAANDTDVDGDTLSVTAVANASGGTASLSAGVITFTPTGNLCGNNTGSYDYTVGDGASPTPGTDTGTVTIDITCVNDAPVANDDSRTVAEDSGATTFGTLLANDTDVESDPIAITGASDPPNGSTTFTAGDVTYTPDANFCGQDSFTYTVNGGDTATVTVTVTCANDAPVAVNDSKTVGEDDPATSVNVLGNDTDVENDPVTITSASDPANGAVVLTGGSAGAHTGLTYQPDPNYCNDPGAPGDDTFTYTVNGGSTATVSVVVTCVDDAPVAVDDTASLARNDPATAVPVLVNDTDVDGGPKAISAASDPVNGTVVLTGGSPGAHTGLTYEPDTGYCNTENADPDDTFTYTLTPGGDTATVSVEVSCDQPPVAVDDSATVAEDAAATAVDVLANDTDSDGGPKVIASASDPANGTVVLTGGSPGAHTGLTYQPDVNYCNNPPGTTPDTFTYTVNGGDTATVSVTVTCIDDAPVAINNSATVAEDSGATAVDVLANDTDVDGGPKTIASATDPTNGTVVLTGGSPGAHTGLTYQPDPNYCNDPPGTTPDTFTYTLNGGSGATVSITVTCVNDAPVADDETFNGNDSAHGNTTLQVDDPTDDKAAPTTPNTEVAGDILAGDTDADGPGPLTVTPGTFASNDGGSVTLEADGDFVFQPAAATSCTDASDFFDYTVEDSGSPEQSDTGRVTIAIVGCVWYVSNNATGNSGTSAAPFDTLAQAETASGANHTVFVFDGDDTTTGYAAGFTMNAGERLIGEHEGLVVDPDQGGVLTADTLHPANPGTRPTLTDPSADVVELDDGNEVRGFNIDPQGGGGIAGAAGDTGGGTIDDVNIKDNGTAGTEPGLELNATTGTFTVTDFTYDNTGVTSTAPGVQLTSAGTVVFAAGDAGDPTKITKTGGQALNVQSTGLGTSVFDEITVAGSATGGIELSTITAGSTTTFGDGSGVDLDLTTTSGATAAFRISSGAGIVVPAGGTANVRATGGPAVDVSSTAGATLSFDDVDSTNSASDGVNLAGLGTGTFSASSGDIGGAAGISFDLDDGSGDVTYPGNLNNGSGQTAEVTGRDGGTVTLSGPIADTSDAGGGIVVSGNNGGSTVFGNAAKTINTTTSAGAGSPLNNAVVFSGSDGHTLTLSGGGLDIDTTVGNGLDATTSGTLNVTGTGNSIVTTTGRALRVSDTDVGASPLSFQSIAANGAPTGILLNNTGSNPSLTVTGNGGTCVNGSTAGCSGGEIRNGAGADGSGTTPDGTGIVLNNTVSPSFTRMHIHDHSNYAIRGTAVNGFTLANSVINGVNGDNGTDPFSDSSVRFFNGSGVGLQGSASVTNTHIEGGYEDNFRVSNTSGSLNRLTFNTVSIGANSTAGGNDGIIVEGTGTSTVNVTLQSSTLTSSRGDLFQMIADGSGGGDLDWIDNTLSNNHPGIGTGGGGVSLFGGATAGGTFDVTMSGTNSFRDAVGHAILLVKSVGGGSMNGSISNIAVGQDTAGDNSGSLEGSAIKVQHAGGGGTASVDIVNSTVREYNNFGIELQSGAGVMSNGTLSVNVTGNTITDPGSNPSVTGFQGVALNSGVTPGDTFSSCLHLKANTVAGAGSPDLPADDIRVRARQSTTVTLPGYAGSLTDTAAIVTFLANQNDAAPNDPGANPPVPTASATKDASATYSGSGTSCP